MKKPVRNLLKGTKYMSRNTQDNVQYFLMISIPVVLVVLFCYLPMFGIIISFQDYFPGDPFIGKGARWVGFQWFKEFLSSYYFKRIIRNTLNLSFRGLVLGFPIPIIFALIVNEIKSKKFKSFTQTISYMPNFLSIVIVATMATSFIGSGGIVVELLQFLGVDVETLTTSQPAFPWVYFFTSTWMSFGWSSILYLSTMAGIDPGLYEAAEIDGASRMQRIWYITIPSIMPLVMINLIMAIGGILGSNVELILQLYNPSVFEVADVIGTYVYREGLFGNSYSYGTACGLLLSIFAFILTYIANALCRKFTDWSMW